MNKKKNSLSSWCFFFCVVNVRQRFTTNYCSTECFDLACVFFSSPMELWRIHSESHQIACDYCQSIVNNWCKWRFQESSHCKLEIYIWSEETAFFLWQNKQMIPINYVLARARARLCACAWAFLHRRVDRLPFSRSLAKDRMIDMHGCEMYARRKMIHNMNDKSLPHL